MKRELTGRHVLFIVLSFFGVIIAVNLYMATMAVSTFPGLEGQNTYYASQSFDANRKAQIKLGWTLERSYEDGVLKLDFRDAETGTPAAVEDLEVLVGRATVAGSDQTPVFIRDNGIWVAPIDLGIGKWLLRVEARAVDGTRFRQSLELYVRK